MANNAAWNTATTDPLARSVQAVSLNVAAVATAASTDYPEVTISGSGFGARTSAFDFYDNYNSYADGTLCGEIGYSDGSSYGGRPAIQSADSHEGNGKALELIYPALGNRYPKVRRDTDPTETLYAAFWFKWTAPPNAGDVGIFKIFRTGEVPAYFMEPLFYDTIRGSDGIQTTMDAGVRLEDESYNQAGNRTNLKHANQWLWLEYYCELSTATVADGRYFCRVNGQTSFSRNDFVTRQIAESRMRYVIGMFDGRDRDAHETGIYQSEEYLSTSMARVVITDNADYSLSTKWQIQPVVSWSNTSITHGQVLGAVGAGEAFRHVFNESDQLILSEAV